KNLTPRSILTPAAFSNTVKTALALSTSINTLRHLQAVAEEASCPIDVYELFDQFGDQIPLLAAIRPNGVVRIEDLEAAGGTAGVMKRLRPVLDTEVMTVSGTTLAANLDKTPYLESPHVYTLDKPLSRQPSLIILRGSLAPEGSILKRGDASGKADEFTGVARVFNSQEAALAALAEGEMKPGTIAVLRGMGPKGGPGVALASSFVAAIDGAGLSRTVAVITDGQLSGLNRGIAVGQVSPEAAA